MFEYYPRIQYDFINEDGTFSVEMQDIFRRVSITKETLDDSSNFKFYTINDGDTPERIAAEVYDDSRLWWLILMMNGVVDVVNEWPKSVTGLDRLFDDFLNGYSYFIMETLGIQKDDVMVKRDVTAEGSIDTSVYGVIEDYDSFLHKINIKNQRASETKLDENDEFYIYRKIDDEFVKIDGFGYTACARQSIGSTGCASILGPTAGYNIEGVVPVPNGPHCAIAGSTFGIVRRRTSIKNGLKRFEYKYDPLNPYSVPNGEGASGDFFLDVNQSLCGYTSCILYKYITEDVIPEYIKVISSGADIIRGNDDRRVIKLLKPSIVRQVVKEFSTLISGNVPPGTTRYITLI